MSSVAIIIIKFWILLINSSQKYADWYNAVNSPWLTTIHYLLRQKVTHINHLHGTTIQQQQQQKTFLFIFFIDNKKKKTYSLRFTYVCYVYRFTYDQMKVCACVCVCVAYMCVSFVIMDRNIVIWTAAWLKYIYRWNKKWRMQPQLCECITSEWIEKRGKPTCKQHDLKLEPKKK